MLCKAALYEMGLLKYHILIQIIVEVRKKLFNGWIDRTLILARTKDLDVNESSPIVL